MGETVERMVPRELPAWMDFGSAIAALKAGQRVARHGWNGKGMWLTLIGAEEWGYVGRDGDDVECAPWIGMRTADGKFVPWFASQTDMLAEDCSTVPAIGGGHG